jgi:hypothetical protein
MKRSFIIISLFILFAAPGLCAYVIYSHPQWISARTTNHGRLLQPAPKLQQQNQTEKWQLLYWMPQACTQACLQRMDDLAKLRLALGRRLYYVDLVLATPLVSDQSLQDKLEQMDGHVLQINEQNLDILGNKPAIYLVNPQHYVILAYSEQQAVKDIYQDLQKMVHDK